MSKNIQEELVEHRGGMIPRKEKEVLEELEKLCGIEIHRVEKLEWDTFGFLEEDKRVKGVSMDGLYLKTKLITLPDSIGKLTNLTKLDLSNNQFYSCQWC